MFQIKSYVHFIQLHKYKTSKFIVIKFSSFSDFIC
jgi:hypothetical protein